ncbi:MAG: cardiolipin synthase [Lachnospiraceae bacterium]|nr:cardiolipin synthase [Lachnospiraceae bacterium]
MGIFKKILRFFSNRITLIVFAMEFQFLWYLFLFFFITRSSMFFYVTMWVIAFITVLWLINRRINPSYKLIWTILILAMPVVGLIFYHIMSKSRVAKKFQKELTKVKQENRKLLRESPKIREKLRELDRGIANQSWYLTDTVSMPCYQNTVTKYFSVGEDWFAKYVKELKKAEHYIFMEYFIVAEGYMWETVLDILKEKVKQGVDVRLIYDGIGCLTTLSAKYCKKLQAYGIKCAAFNSFRPFLNIMLNNRDHRKITLIDGHTAFNGGINLADEYINQRSRFGHWKDSGIYIHGEAVWNMIALFLEMWSFILKTSCNFEKYRLRQYSEEFFESDGFVQPYGDSPLDDEAVGENVYRNLISNAKKYAYIFTPYLVLDNEMMTELCNAAKRGVDVRIVTPGIPDKKIVFLLTQSYYQQLLESGVKIYEYTPGFIHSKSCVCDDEAAVVSTINLDYRSLYLHFECGIWLYQTKSVMEIKKDALNTFKISREIDLSFCKKRHLFIRVFQSVLRAIAPIL